MPWPLYHGEKDLVPTVQEADWALGPAWTCTENLTSTRVETWY